MWSIEILYVFHMLDVMLKEGLVYNTIQTKGYLFAVIPVFWSHCMSSDDIYDMIEPFFTTKRFEGTEE